MTRNTPWGEIGYITYKRTYARKLKDTGTATEEFEQTVDRVINGAVKQLRVPFTDEEQVRLKELMLDLKGFVAGRFMWQLGTKTVDKLGLASLQNCAFITVDHPITPFTWAFDMLMLGSGVGYNIQREFVYKLPKVLKRKIRISRLDTPDADFIVPDSREGWVKLLGKVLKAYFYSGEGFTYSTICIRGKGSPIKSFGGTASGPEDLVSGISNICSILDARKDKQLRPIDCLDIMNIIGSIVVAGNVRRSAQIAIGDYDDVEFLRAKDWSSGKIPNWRAMSNNSIVCNNFDDILPQFWDGYTGKGEPYGLINLGLSQSCGRIGETQYPDPKVAGYNPSLRGGTKVWTSNGIKNIETLQDTEFLVKNLNNEIVPAKCWLSNPAAPLYKITLEGGHEYFCTAEHKWVIYTPQGYVKCETTELKPGHLFPINKSDSITNGSLGGEEDGFFIGWLYGDGGIHIRKDNGRPQLNLIVSKKDDESRISGRLLTKLNSIKGEPSSWVLRNGNKELSCSAAAVFTWLDSFGVDYENKHLPSKIWGECSEDFRRGFIDGLISSDGSVESNYKSAKIRLTACTNKEIMIREFSELLGFYGIKNDAHYCETKLNNKVFGRYNLSIASRENISHFRKLFSLSVEHKQLSLMDISTAEAKPMHGHTHKIKSIELTNLIEPVWDIHVMDNTHCFQIAHVITGNCAEQSLENGETCCLAEIPLPNISSLAELKEVATYLYRICKHSLAIKCHHQITEDIVHKNMRMGIGVTGYAMASDEQKSWLDETYKFLRVYDKYYSAENGFNESIKLTTTKPSGTLSLLAGVTPGAHPGFAQYFIRRVRMSSDSQLVKLCRENGYHIEYVRNFDGTEDKGTVVVSFPCKFPKGTKLAKDVTAIDQLNTVKELQTIWSDNAVSVTVYYKLEELEDIKAWLKANYNTSLKSVSFLLHSDHGFDQAPYEEITESEYKYMSSLVKPITAIESFEEDELDSAECTTGMCPVK